MEETVPVEGGVTETALEQERPDTTTQEGGAKRKHRGRRSLDALGRRWRQWEALRRGKETGEEVQEGESVSHRGDYVIGGEDLLIGSGGKVDGGKDGGSLTTGEGQKEGEEGEEGKEVEESKVKERSGKGTGQQL